MEKGYWSAAEFLRCAGGMITNPNSFRGDALNTVLDDETVVDTVCAPDTGYWETGIQRKDDEWIIVEQYDDKVKAEKGHKKWVVSLKADPGLELVSCQDFGF